MPLYRDDTDCERFLELLGRVVETHGVRCSAYCLMVNHYHLVLTTASANLSDAIKLLNGTYGQWWNRRHGRVGHVFQARFHAQVVQDDTYLLAVCRYIVLNPVRARLAPDPEGWPWSSYRATAGMTAIPPLLKPEILWRHLSCNSRETAVSRYRQLISAHETSTASLPMDSVLGDARFVEGLQGWRDRASCEVPRRERQTRPSLEAIFSGAPTRAVRAAQSAEAYTVGYTMAEIARYLQLHPSTVSRMVGAEARRVRSCKMFECKT